MITGAHSNVTNGNRTNGQTFTPNGKSMRPVNGRPAQPSKPSSYGVYASEQRKPALFADRRCASSTQALRREFLPLAAGRSETGSALPERATSENEIIFFYCVKGAGWCELEGKRYEFTPGQLLVLPAKARRACGAFGEGPCSLIWIQLAAINMDAFLAELNVAPQITTFGTGEKTQVLALFHEVMQALEMPCPERSLQVSQRAMHLLANSISRPREGCQVQTDSSAKIGQTIEFMKEHLNEPLRAATLAGVAKMSLPHYFALFKRVVGSSPIDYLIKLRMEHARRLLAETSWSVKEVAVSLGYDDPLYFSRVFKSNNQTAPSNFRAKKKRASEK